MTEPIAETYKLTNLNLEPYSPEKLIKLTEANKSLNINKQPHNKLVFVYSCPKVGSTSVVSSLRIFGMDKIDIIHIHDEEMLKVLTNIKDVTINDIILFNAYLKKEVFVINIYRNPIERKISTFFEKVGCYHFNNNDEAVNHYQINRVINRFNNIFPWLNNKDHFIDKYGIKLPEHFDFTNKYVLVKENNVHYISLRLKDSNEWGNILTNIFGFKICIVKDYESSNKPIKDLYQRFKKNYKIPINLLNDTMKDKYLNYYYSTNELQNYYIEWLNKSCPETRSYNYEEYKVYESITIENCHKDIIQLDHYFDEGCVCKACNIKRLETMTKILRGIDVKDRIVHINAKTELIKKRVDRAHTINNLISKIPRGKDFKRDMNVLISNGIQRL